MIVTITCIGLLIMLALPARRFDGRSALDVLVERLTALTLVGVLAVMVGSMALVMLAMAGAPELSILLAADITLYLEALFAGWLLASSRTLEAAARRVTSPIRRAIAALRRVRPGTRREVASVARPRPEPANDDDRPRLLLAA